MKLSSRITVLILLVIGIVTTSSMAIVGVKLSQHNHETMRQWSQTLTSTLAESIANDTLNGNVIRVQDILKNIIVRHPSLEYAFLTDFDNRIFASTFEKGFPEKLLQLTQIGAKQEQLIKLDSKELHDFSYPLVNGLEARLHLGFSQREQSVLMNGLYSSIFLLTLLLGLGAVVLSVYMSRRMTRSIETIADSISAYGKGDTSNKKISFNPDEYEANLLATAFSKMLEERDAADYEKALSDKLLERVFDTTHTLMAYLDTSFNFIRVNQAYLDADNKTAADVIGKNHFELYPDKENEEIFKQVLMTGEEYSVQAKAFEYGRNPERGLSYWNWSLQPVRENGEIEALLLVLVNVTEQIEAQQSVIRNEETMIAAQGIGHFGSWDWNVVTGELSWSDEIYRIFGHQAQAYSPTYDAFLEAIHPDDRELVSRSITACIEDAEIHYEVEHRIIRADGEIREVREQGEVFYNESGKPVRMLGVVHDITEQRQAEQALRSSIELNNTIISESPVGISIYDETGQCIAANKAIADMVGASKEQVLQQNYHTINSWKASGLYAAAEQVLVQGTTQREEFSVMTTFGREISLDAYISKFENAGKPHLLLMLNDVSERNKADAELRIRDTAIATSINPISMSDMEGRITYVNQAYIDMWGYDHEDEILGRSPMDMSGSADEVESVVDELMLQGSWQGEITSKRKDGSLFATQIAANVVHDQFGKPICLMASFVDVTERKQILNELTQHKENLELLVLERTDELEKTLQLVKQENEERKRMELSLIQAKNEAERANNLKSEFLGRMSHELRTPMNAILGFGQLLEMENLNETHADYVAEISRAGKHLLDLINEVLDLSKIESGNIELVVDAEILNDIISASVSLVSSEAEDKGISIHNEVSDAVDVIISVDHTRFKEVIVNLLTNAIKYNRPGGAVSIDSKMLGNGMLRISIKDTGPGIPKDKQQAIFEPFNRMGAEFTDIEGTGIGLSIAKQLIEMMQGRIGVESVPGEGSTFWIECPVLFKQGIDKPRADLASVNKLATVQALPVPQGVLYIEDNPANLRLVQKLLNRVPNISLYSAATAELGLELARSKKPALILMDINLPGMDGYQALSRLRNYPETCDIPVIAISAAAMPEDRERGRMAGFKHYLTKPLQVNSLMQLLDDELGKAGKRVKNNA